MESQSHTAEKLFSNSSERGKGAEWGGRMKETDLLKTTDKNLLTND